MILIAPPSFPAQEVRSVAASAIHQAFLKDTTLAKLVHFQVCRSSVLD